jgi:hypothetical protein
MCGALGDPLETAFIADSVLILIGHERATSYLPYTGHVSPPPLSLRPSFAVRPLPAQASQKALWSVQGPRQSDSPAMAFLCRRDCSAAAARRARPQRSRLGSTRRYHAVARGYPMHPGPVITQPFGSPDPTQSGPFYATCHAGAAWPSPANSQPMSIPYHSGIHPIPSLENLPLFASSPPEDKKYFTGSFAITQ